MWRKNLLFLCLLSGLSAQTKDVLKYPLPDPLICQDGSPCGDAITWREKRRPEIMQLFAAEVFGKTPASTSGVHFETDSVDKHALNGTAIRKQVTVFFTADERGPRMHVLLYLPARSRKRVPVFLGLNFFGNETVSADPGIDLPEIWVKDASDSKTTYGGELQKHHKQRAMESDRGTSEHLWQVEKILAHGFGLATAYCGDIEPDFLGGIHDGVRWTFLQAGETKPPADEWGALGAWAWGLSRIADYLEKDKNVDSKKLIVSGFSRLGKAALWSAAQDSRFSVVISSESGVGGASLYRAATSESIEHLNTAFPYWFAESFHKYSGHPEQVPVDGNLLLALIAPRPLYVASAEEDRQSDPPAEYLSALDASKVYRLLGAQGFTSASMPAVNNPVASGVLAYHVRSGKHDVTAYDWEQYLTFAENMLARKN